MTSLATELGEDAQDRLCGKVLGGASGRAALIAFSQQTKSMRNQVELKKITLRVKQKQFSMWDDQYDNVYINLKITQNGITHTCVKE